MRINLKPIFFVLCLAGVLYLTVLGALRHQGSTALYLAFSALFLSMLVAGAWKQESYGYMFLALFVWLGFWLKFTAHTILGTPYIEPIGDFVLSPANLDAVILVACCAAIGIILARFVPSIVPAADSPRYIAACPVPVWYKRFSFWFWAGLWSVILLAPAANIALGISQTGLVPRLTLPWPLSGIVPWVLSTGIGLCVMTLLSWDVAAGRSPFRGLYALTGESLFSSVSLLSRGTFLWHALPVLGVSFNKGRELLTNLSKFKLCVLAGVWLAAFIFSFILVNALRHQYFYFDPQAALAKSFRAEVSILTLRATSLAVDRWIGLDGVMAVHAYAGKGKELFSEAVLEKRSLNKMGLYQTICKYPYKDVDIEKYNFGAVPGLAAFFYYSGSLMVVAIGAFFVALLLRFSEDVIYYFTSNVFLCSFFGVTYANIFAQFSMAPRQIVWQSMMMAGSLVVIWWLQRGFIRSAQETGTPAPDRADLGDSRTGTRRAAQ